MGRRASGDVMPSLIRCSKATLIVTALLLGGCATVSESDLSQPNFGLQKYEHFDASVNPDPMNIANGLYAPRSLQYSSGQSQLNWGSWQP
jgi:hypothetical protein